MEEKQIKCSQCEWLGHIRPGRVPIYGARIRCPRCGSLQFLPPVSLESSIAELPTEEVLIEAVASPERTSSEELASLRTIITQTEIPSFPIPGDGLPEAEVEIKPEAEVESRSDFAPDSEEDERWTGKWAHPTEEEAREVISIWLKELSEISSEPLTISHLFTEFSDELAHIFALWKATYPGEKAIKLFREQLMIEISPISRGKVNQAKESCTVVPISANEVHDRIN